MLLSTMEPKVRVEGARGEVDLGEVRGRNRSEVLRDRRQPLRGDHEVAERLDEALKGVGPEGHGHERELRQRRLTVAGHLREREVRRACKDCSRRRAGGRGRRGRWDYLCDDCAPERIHVVLIAVSSPVVVQSSFGAASSFMNAVAKLAVHFVKSAVPATSTAVPFRIDGGVVFGQYMRSIRMKRSAGAGSQFASLSLVDRQPAAPSLASRGAVEETGWCGSSGRTSRPTYARCSSCST